MYNYLITKQLTLYKGVCYGKIDAKMCRAGWGKLK